MSAKDHYSEGDNTTSAAVVADLAAQALGVVAEEGNAKVVIVPRDAQAEVIDLSRYSTRPWRPKGTAHPKSVESFVSYVSRHLTDETTIWVEPLDGRIIAVLNDHGPGQAEAFGDLRADLTLPVTPEWEHWAKRDKVYGTQRDFAEHIEEGLTEIRTPSAAEVLEFAQTMQATVTADFKQASRLDDGTITMQWAEHVDARAGKAGDVTIPQEIILGIAPFYGEQPYEVRARIRYRIAGGDLKIGYALDRPDVVVRDCLMGIRDRLRDTFGDAVLVGAPRGPQTD
jgi:uncharacterized protein YfdQ (DUF2303 family)